jgi:glycosyltransferase involved in cell wall biosynthesis
MAETTLRILQINTERGWRGGERQTLLTAVGLRERGHAVELLLREGSALVERARALGLVVHTAGGGFSFGCWLALHGKRYDVLHAQTAKVVAWAVVVVLAHRRPMVFSRRTSFPVGSRGWFTRLKWRRLDQMVAISEAAADAPRALGVSTQVIPSAVLPSTPNAPRVQHFLKHRALEGRRLVGTAAALSIEKDPVTLIHAAAKVCAQFEDVVFVHWGAAGAASHSAQHAITELGLQDRYLLLGFEPEVEQLFAALSVFVMSSRYEALGSSVLDAMLQNVPVVSTDAGGLKETVCAGRGLVCAPGDVATMAAHIAWMLAQPEQAKAMAEVARAAVRAEYSVDSMVESYIRVYREVLGTQGADY